MRHGRADYDERVQDSAGLIPEDEPVFLLRAQDLIAPKTLEFYARAVQSSGGPLNVCNRVVQHSNRMRDWQRKLAEGAFGPNVEEAKLPDLPEGIGEVGRIPRKSGPLTLLPSGVYEHHKGQHYLVVGQARHSETGEYFVVYVPLYGINDHRGSQQDVHMAVRPARMFTENVEGGRPRFRWIGGPLDVSIP